ncbi:hypothetical protein chiPu_0027347 [Chiloscyllium punctatum]|uniref:Uncharacterized protein n=1 Tax=Chiloscyllium punctatum TaxID=137246 RepID=A0A401TL94_CHIPU|nr:hypothetical protein [Chiloscyllium punctatum]
MRNTGIQPALPGSASARLGSGRGSSSVAESDSQTSCKVSGPGPGPGPGSGRLLRPQCGLLASASTSRSVTRPLARRPARGPGAAPTSDPRQGSAWRPGCAASALTPPAGGRPAPPGGGARSQFRLRLRVLAPAGGQPRPGGASRSHGKEWPAMHSQTAVREPPPERSSTTDLRSGMKPHSRLWS